MPHFFFTSWRGPRTTGRTPESRGLTVIGPRQDQRCDPVELLCVDEEGGHVLGSKGGRVRAHELLLWAIEATMRIFRFLKGMTTNKGCHIIDEMCPSNDRHLLALVHSLLGLPNHHVAGSDSTAKGAKGGEKRERLENTIGFFDVGVNQIPELQLIHWFKSRNPRIVSTGTNNRRRERDPSDTEIEGN